MTKNTFNIWKRSSENFKNMGCEQIRRNASSSTIKSLFVDTALTSTDSTRPQDKIDAVVHAPQPGNKQELRSFLGLVNYYHRFLPNLATAASPLNKLLEQNRKCVWSEESQAAFAKVKELITSDLVLTHYDPKLPVKLACDASPVGIGAVLSHVMEDNAERPIAYASRTLSKTERNYSQIDKEALTLIWGVKKFYQYLFGRHFTLVTDHQPLTSIFNPRKGIPCSHA